MKRHPPDLRALGARSGSDDADRALLPWRPASEVLAAEHQLSRTESARRAVTRHMLTAGALLAACVAAVAGGATWAAA